MNMNEIIHCFLYAVVSLPQLRETALFPYHLTKAALPPLFLLHPSLPVSPLFLLHPLFWSEGLIEDAL